MLAATSAALLGGLMLSASSTEVGARPSIALRQADGTELPSDIASIGDVTGAHPKVSGDGRFVVFEARPGADVEGDEPPVDERQSTIYLSDRESGETTELTAVPSGLRTGDSVHPVISGDGCVVVVVTELALDVFRDDDTGERWDVYRSILPHCGGQPGDWELVSSRPNSGGLARDDVLVAPATVSRSGALVAFTHPADHLFEGDELRAISLVDLAVPINATERTRFVAGMPIDSPDNAYLHVGLDQPALSDDGAYLAYRSDATSAEAVPGWGTGPVEGEAATPQIYLWRIAEPDPFLAVQLMSIRPDGSPSATGAGQPDISRDGLAMTFTSSDSGLVDALYPDCEAVCPTQVFHVDRDVDDDGLVAADEVPELRLLSAVAGTEPPVAGTSPSSQPSMSADGQLVAFVSTAANLQLIEAPGMGSGDDGEIMLAELHRGGLQRLTVSADGVVPTPGVHAHPDLSDSGRVAVFDSAAAAAILGVEATSVTGRQVVAKTMAPQLSLPDADLGTTLVGLQGDEWYVAVINDGPSSFQPASVDITNSQFSINSDKSTCLLSTAIPAGGSCTVALSYVPRAPGPTSGTITVAEAGFGAVGISANVAGAGGEPTLRIEPAGADLGLVTVGDSSVEFQFDVSNISIIPTSLAEFEITGAHASDFEFSSNNCVDRPLNPRASCSMGITFTPSDAGRRTALVELATPSGQYTTMVVAGDGEYEPVVEAHVGSVEAGSEFLASGSHYPPNTEVTIVFGDDPSESITTTTNAVGDFAVFVPVSSLEHGGERTVVVQTSSGAGASASVEVIETEQQLVGMPGFGLG